MPTLFEKIVAGEIPSHKVYEDEQVVAFLDIEPISRGHTLVIPKRGYVTLEEMPADVAGAVGAALPKVARAIREATGCDGLNVLQNNGKIAGQAVMHVHFHLIPRYAEGKGGDGLTYRWDAGKLTGADELCEAIASRLAG